MTGLGIEFHYRKVEVQLESGKGPEASARDARYAALHAEVRPGDWLLSAHHREDQAETLLLNLVRGSGPAGIAGIGAVRRFGPAWLVRPLLDFDREDLKGYATRHGIHWIEDPSNADKRFDRNFLRHEILPRLKERWPDIATRLQRSALHAGEASALLVDLAKIDLEALGGQSGRLPVQQLLDLPRDRRKNLIRYALRARGLSCAGRADRRGAIATRSISCPTNCRSPCRRVRSRAAGWNSVVVSAPCISNRVRNAASMQASSDPGCASSIARAGRRFVLMVNHIQAN